jgi:hypothetical protein
MYARLFFLTLRASTIFLKSESVNMKTKAACAHLAATARSRDDTKTKTCAIVFPPSEIQRAI